MKKLGLALCLFVGLAPAHAQPVTNPVSAGIAGAYNSAPPTCTAGQFCFAQVSSVGRLLVDAAVSGGGDATAANQVLQIAQETAFNTALGAMADAACATDNGTCSTIALLKRGNQRLTTIIAGIPVTNAGTFAVQATLVAETTKVIGTVNQGTSPWVISGSLTANQSVNVAQMNGVTTTMGNGIAGTGVQRVAIASDNTAFSVNATLAANTANTYVGNVNTQGTKATYRVAGNPAIDAAGVIVQLQGSGTKTVRVTRIVIGGVLTVTSNGNITVNKNTATATGGTSTAPTIVPLDSASAAATAVALRWTAVPTAGAAVGTLADRRSTWTADTLANSGQASFTFGDANGQALTLRGTAEFMTVTTANFTSYTGASYNFEVEWTEE